MAPPAELLNAYSGNKLLVFTAIFIPAQVICVTLRYLARYLVKGPWGLDDAVVLLSLALQLSMGAISVASVYYGGVGYHLPYLEETRPQTVITWGKFLVAISFIYFGSVNIPKFAILALYYRLFAGRANHIMVLILAGFLAALTMSTVITAFAACRPFAANWNPALPGAYCIDKEAFFRWGSLPNILSDIVMLVLPLRVVWNLHTTTRLKIGLTLTFVVGSFGLVTSIVRFTTFFKKNSFIDGTWSAVDLIIWTQLETGVYLISACLMTYRPLLERIGWGRIISKVTQNSASGPTPVKKEQNHSSSIPLQPRIQKREAGFLRLESDIVVTTDINVDQKRRTDGSDIIGLEGNGSVNV